MESSGTGVRECMGGAGGPMVRRFPPLPWAGRWMLGSLWNLRMLKRYMISVRTKREETDITP